MGPYPPITAWRIPSDALRLTLEGVRSAGDRGVESGALWLGDRGVTSIVSAVVLPHGDGVLEAPSQWQISPEVVAAVTSWAKPRGLVLLAVFHIHVGRSVDLSWSDRHHGVQVPGMLSVIAGNGGRDAAIDHWGWYIYDDSDYREISAPERKRRLLLDKSSSCSVWRATVAEVSEK